MGNGNAQGCTGSALGVIGNDIKQLNLELLSQGAKNGANEQ